MSSISPSIELETRLFYVRIGPCAVNDSPEFLTLRHLLGVDGIRAPTPSTLRRDRIDQETFEVTYVGTDTVRITGSVGFEVYEKQEMLLCGSIERIDQSDWRIDCYAEAAGFFRPKVGVSSQSIEVYVAGRCSNVPVILTKMINVSTRRKNRRHCPMDAIPEVEYEVEKDEKLENGLIWRGKSQLIETYDDYERERKIADGWYPEEIYEGEDGQLTWFNAGVRVGVGIGLGMCIGAGIGVGLLMRSYQTTSRNLKRRFF